jgi:16S rRNA processing protein RimM
MKVEDCFYLGSVRKAHGIQGEVKVYLDVDDIAEYNQQESVYLLKEGKLTPVFIDKIRIISDHQAVVKFRHLADRNDAEALYGTEMYLPADLLPPLSDTQFYYHEIAGYTLVDEVLGELGLVIRVDEMPAQDLVVLEYKGSEALIPITDEIIIKADREKKQLISHLPEGLLDVYDVDVSPKSE